ncbi:MAG: hypothetical protein QM831_17665 [Kofleriaceae bacterium]
MARVGESIVAATESDDFRIGTSPDVSFAVEGMTSFPLVAGRTMRRPLGLGELRVNGELSDASDVALVPGIRIELRLQLVTFSIELVDRTPWRAKPLWDRKMPIYVAWLLLAHVAIAVLALGVSRPPPPRRQRPKLVAHPVLARLNIVVPKPTTPQQPKPAPPKAAKAGHGSMQHGEAHDQKLATTTSKFAGYQHLSEGVREALGGLGAMDTSALIAATDIGMVRDALANSTPYDVNSTYDGFGGKAELMLHDPRKDKDAYKTIASQRYMTISSGPHAGGGKIAEEDELRVNIALCDSWRCEVSGALAKETLQAAVHHVGAALVTCVKDKAVYVDLAIAADGHVKAKGKGSQAACAARVIEQNVEFPASDGATKAKFTIGYPES